MSFRIRGLSPEPFQHLYGLSDAQLKQQGAIRCRVDRSPGFPDRIELNDCDVGQTAILIHYEHQPAATPYRASHAIFVREGASSTFDRVDAVPRVLHIRPISLRAFDGEHLIADAELASGDEVETAICRLFANERVAYLHAHYAKFGCYAARIDRE